MKRRLLLLQTLCAIGAGAATVEPVSPAPENGVVTEAWCIAFQVMTLLPEYLSAHELSAIHYEELPLSTAVSTLLRTSGMVPPEQRSEYEAQLISLARRVADLHTAGDANDQAKAEEVLQTILKTFNEVERLFGPHLLAPARAMADRYTCPMHADVIGKKGKSCPKCGMPLDQLIRPAVFQPGSIMQPSTTVLAEVHYEKPLEVGRQFGAVLHLKHIGIGEPVVAEELRETHTQKIHLLIVDLGLSDYHHEHPVALPSHGDYSFSFTPQKPGPYLVWADVRPVATGFEEYASAKILAATAPEPISDKATCLATEVDGLHYLLRFDETPLRANRPARAHLRITTANGKPFTALEPLMGAYAHIAGFSEDLKTVLHLHPEGMPPREPEDRAGPDLAIRFYSVRPGFFRLFAQVQINGVSRFARFSVTVEK